MKYPHGAPIKVLLLENVHSSAKDLLSREGFEVESLPIALQGEELAKKIADVHLLGIRSKTQVTQAVLSSAKSLHSVACFCIGTNQVDLEFAQKSGVCVFNAPFSNTRSVAEMVIANIINLARQLPDRSKEVHQGKWRKVSKNCFEVRGKTLGIVGYGHIGTQVGTLAEMLGMSVIYYDILAKLSLGNSRSCSSLDEVLSQSHFVTLHVPATSLTKKMIGERQLSQMKKGSFLINAARNTIVDIDAVAQALKSGHLAGCAFDVFPGEPDGNSDDFKTVLQEIPNVILTPHIGGSTEEAQVNIAKEVSASLIKFVQQGASTGSVNFPAIESPVPKNTHRILNVHKNVPGVLRDINKIVSDLNANIHGQNLSTEGHIGYLIMDIDQDVSASVLEALSKLSNSIKTRIVS